jgi:hypothetical protein
LIAEYELPSDILTVEETVGKQTRVSPIAQEALMCKIVCNVKDIVDDEKRKI